MALEEQQLQDPTTQGTRGLRGLEGVDRLRDRGINIDTSIFNMAEDYRGTMSDILESSTPTQDIGFEGVGDSRLDKQITSATQLDDIANTRGELQPWLEQLGAGVAKGVILAGTTFLDGTLGLLLGGAQAIGEGRMSAMWDNPFSKAMQSVNEWSEQALPNYYTNKEMEDPWYENIFTANFIGDKFVKNLGFTVGAFYSGGVASKALKVTKLPQLMGIIMDSSKAPAIISSGVGATISSVNEGRIEAINNSKDWFELNKTALDDEHALRLQNVERQYRDSPMYDFMINRANTEYEEAINNLTESRLKMGNTDMLLNLPILMASNLYQFGRMYANGFKTARKATNIVNREGKYLTKKATSKGVAKAALAPLSEGLEEISQSVASRTSGIYYGTDPNDFYVSKIDPEHTEQTTNWLKAFAQGVNETVNEGSSWEEFFIGSLTGALGMPRFRSVRSSSGRVQSPVTLEGGVLGQYKDYQGEIQRDQQIVDYLNDRVSSPEFLNYYQGLIRHNKYQSDMDRAVEDNDEFEFKNAEHSQLVSDIAMFDNAGKLEDLITLVESAYDTSDENLQAIVENTTSTNIDESGNEYSIGPFIDKNGNPMFSTAEGKKEMVDKLTQTRDEMVTTINNYVSTRDDIDVRTGQELSDEQLEELTWLKTKTDDWNQRASQLSSEIKPSLGNIISTFNDLVSYYTQIRNYKGQAHAGLSEAYKDADEKIQNYTHVIENLDLIRNLSEEVLAKALAMNERNTKVIKDILKDTEDLNNPGENAETIRKIDDAVKLVNATNKFNIKLKEYLENPSSLQEQMDNTKDNLEKEETSKKNSDLKSRLQSATDLNTFRQALSEAEDTSSIDSVLDELDKENNELAKNYREVENYNNDIQRVVNSLDNESPLVKEDALRLFEQQYNNSDNLEEVANPNSIFIDNDSALYDDDLSPEDNITKFQEAQYALLRAMNIINNENRFKNRFTQDYRDLKPQGKPDPDAPTSSTTGDSQTPTVPTVKGASKVDTEEKPVGDISREEVSNENRELNSDTETPESLEDKQKGRRLYYRPTIPQFHIEASKEGDFRPFNQVVREREPNSNFDTIYYYLDDAGAFKYINDGNIKEGDEVGFMIDEVLESNMRQHSWYKGPTILIIDRKNNQVIGSLDEAPRVVERYEGLGVLRKRIVEEYNNRNKTAPIKSTEPELTLDNAEEHLHITVTSDGYRNVSKILDWSRKTRDIRNLPDGFGFLGDAGMYYYKKSAPKGSGRPGDNTTLWFRNKPSNEEKIAVSGVFNSIKGINIEELVKEINIARSKNQSSLSPIDKFIASPTTRVSKVMLGKIPYRRFDTDLSEIPNINTGGNTPVFGIIRNGVLSTNNKLEDSKVIKPLDTSKKEGRMYLLIPNARGTYSPAAVRIKHLNRTELNFENPKFKDTPLAKNLMSAITKLANATNEEDTAIAKEELKNLLYTGGISIEFQSTSAGDALQFRKKFINEQGKEEGDKSTRNTVFLTQGQAFEGELIGSLGVEEGAEAAPITDSRKAVGDIITEIVNILYDYNLPIQVNLNSLNNPNYNNMLINSGALSSNIMKAQVVGSWFTINPFNNEGKMIKAVNPISVNPQLSRNSETVTNNTGGSIEGTATTVGSEVFYADLTTNTVRDAKGNIVRTNDNQRILDIAWANTNFGRAIYSSVMTDNKVIVPSGRVLDRTTQEYLSDSEAQKIKDALQNKGGVNTPNKDVVLEQIAENQKRVDKGKTDSRYYYIQEDDGKFYPYERVHTVLGSNWIESTKQVEAVDKTRVKLSQLADNITQYNNYLRSLNKFYNINLTEFEGKIDVKSRETIVNIVRDAMTGTNSRRALEAGSAIDIIIRNFFTSNEMPVRPPNISEEAFNQLITSLTEIRSNMEANGERFLTDNVVVYHKYKDGRRVAGEVDILSVDNEGNFRIYDVKTSRYSFYDFTDRYGRKVNYYTQKSNRQLMSTEDYYTNQLSSYKNLFESQYKVPITTLGILPFVLNYSGNNVTSINKQKGILVKYNPSSPVPLDGNSNISEKKTNTTPKEEAPVFNKALEIQDPVNNILPEYNMEDTKVGYYSNNGKLTKAYLKPIGQVSDIDIYITKIPEFTRGFGKEAPRVSYNNYSVIFPNGNSLHMLKDTVGMSEEQVVKTILNNISKNPNRVVEMSNEKTILFDPSTDGVKSTDINNESGISGASKTIQAEKALKDKFSEFEDDDPLASYRQTVEEDLPVWNQERELKWLDKVLPQLSDTSKVQVVKGLIPIANSGAKAWGMFDNGIVTLSDIAAEGTTYHEAFHVVFQLLLNPNEREALLQEARELYGNLSEYQLEERLAEGFREYIMSRDKTNWGNKILEFFNSLFHKVTNWKYLRPSLGAYYQMINQGKYAKGDLNISELNRDISNQITFESLDSSLRESLTNKGWSASQFNSVSNLEREQAIKCIDF